MCSERIIDAAAMPVLDTRSSVTAKSNALR
jgi:hypothetical protein